MNLAILLALASGGTWAIGMTVAKPALRHIDVLSYMLGRWLLVAPLALLYAVATGALAFPSGYAVGMAVVAGFIDSALGGLFYLMAMERAPAYQTATLSSTAPVWGVSTAILLLGETPRWEVFVAAVLAVVGAYFLVGRRFRIREHALGSAFGLLTGFLWGFAETIPAKLALRAGLSTPSLLLVFACSGVISIAAFLPFLRSRFPRRIDRTGIRLTVLSAVGGAFLGWVFWLSALELAPASVVSPVRGSTLVFSLVYSILFLRERPNRVALLGVILVLGGVVLVSTAR
jgi:drug/metabolite transporter (DMT)-like permease